MRSMASDDALGVLLSKEAEKLYSDSLMWEEIFRQLFLDVRQKA